MRIAGSVDPTVINGGTLQPGPMGLPGSMAAAGSLAFQSGAFYIVQIVDSKSSLTKASATASLAGTELADVNFAAPLTVNTKYDILRSAGLGGASFDALVLSDPNFRGFLSYSATDAFLTLVAAQLGTGALFLMAAH